MLESKWKGFYDESKKPYSSEEEFAKYCADYSDYVYQSPHIQECLELAKNSDEFLRMIREFEDIE